jgi:hypothetical protein
MSRVQDAGNPQIPCLTREAALTAVACALVLLFCASLLLLDRGFFWIDDMQSGALPGYFDMARSLLSGELPLLGRSSWRATALGAEFPAGVFSPTLAVCILIAYGSGLPLPLAAATISVIHLMILAAGTIRLARQRGLSPDLSLLVALVATLNGWLMLWGARNWGVCLFSFAWLPWYWWALEYARQEGRGWARFVPAGLFLFLLIAAGWPLTVLMAALISAWVMLRTWVEKRRILSLWTTPAAWVVGMGLSAPAWMMFLSFMPNGARTQQGPGLWTSFTWTVPLDGFVGMVLPSVVADWWVYGNLKPHFSAELGGGLVPLVILLGCLWFGGRGCLRANRWEWGLFAVVFVLLVSPSFGNFQWSFRWLPLFFLTLGLLSAQCLAWVREHVPCGKAINFGRIAVFLVALVWVRSVLRGPGLNTIVLAVGACTLVLTYLWWKIEEDAKSSGRMRVAIPVVVVLFSCWTASAAGFFNTEVPVWRIVDTIRRPEPLDPSVRYLSVHIHPDIFEADEDGKSVGGELYLGNTAGYAGLDFVNGYSVMMPIGLQQNFNWAMHGHFEEWADAERVLASETGPGGMLDLMGVDGLVVSDSFACDTITLMKNGWRETAKLNGGRVYRRQGSASPRVRAVEKADLMSDRFEAGERLTDHGRGPAPSILLAKTDGSRQFAKAQVRLIEDGRHRLAAEVKSNPGEGEILVVFSRPWVPGFQAEIDGRPVPVEVYNLILPAVRLPAGTNGVVTLVYRPRAYVLGVGVAGVTASAILVVCLVAAWKRLRRRRFPAAEPVERFDTYIPRVAPVDGRLGKEVSS